MNMTSLGNVVYCYDIDLSGEKSLMTLFIYYQRILLQIPLLQLLKLFGICSFQR